MTQCFRLLKQYKSRPIFANFLFMRNGKSKQYDQARYWILTIPRQDWSKPEELPEECNILQGQLEVGQGGFEHWQLFVGFKKPTRLRPIKQLFGQSCHAEPTRSAAAEKYVFKEDTCVQETRFSLGTKAIKRADSDDWDTIRELAKTGELERIPSDVYIRYYSSLKKISVEFSKPGGIQKQVIVYWGATGLGKSRKAWHQAGDDAYPKTPTTKFWDGYNGQQAVVIDEFRGQIEISHMLRWLDRYPCLVEIKGSSVVLRARSIWITSNISPECWYPNLDEKTRNALLRRLEIHQFIFEWKPPHEPLQPISEIPEEENSPNPSSTLD